MKTQIFMLSLLTVTSLLAETNATIEKPKNTLSLIDDKLNMYGDVRIRHQEVYYEGDDNVYQQRYRIRLGLTYAITDDLVFEVQTSSGKGNPTSGNVKFTDGLGMEQFKVDVLDLQYKFDNSWIRAGKSKHYFYRPMKTQLIWDNDLRPEGVSYGYKENDRFTAGLWKVNRDEYKNDPLADDIYFFAAQYIHQLQYSENTRFNIGGGYHHYEGVQGNMPAYGKGALGNSVNADGTYMHDYRVLEFTAEVKFKEVLGKPLKLATTLAYNTAVSDDNFAYDLSLQWGSAKENNLDWQLGYTYRDLQKDALYAAHNDSDFIAGGTDGKGHIFKGKMRLNPNLYTAFHYQITENYKQVPKKVNPDYKRLMVDLILTF